MKKIAVLLITATFVLTASGVDPAGFTAEHLWQMHRVGAPVVSPDGSRTLFTLTGYDLESNESSTFIYMADNETGEKSRSPSPEKSLHHSGVRRENILAS